MHRSYHAAHPATGATKAAHNAMMHATIRHRTNLTTSQTTNTISNGLNHPGIAP